MALFPGHKLAIFSSPPALRGTACPGLACSRPVAESPSPGEEASLSLLEARRCTKYDHLICTPALQVGCYGPFSKERKLPEVEQLGGGSAGLELGVLALSRANSPWCAILVQMLWKLSSGSPFGLRGKGVLVSPWRRWKWLNQVYGPTDPRGLQAIWLPRSQDLLPEGSEAHPQMVFTRGYITVQRFFRQRFHFFHRKDQTSFRTGHGLLLGGGEQAPSGAGSSLLQFLHSRSSRRDLSLPPAQRTGLGDN